MEYLTVSASIRAVPPSSSSSFLYHVITDFNIGFIVSLCPMPDLKLQQLPLLSLSVTSSLAPRPSVPAHNFTKHTWSKTSRCIQSGMDCTLRIAINFQYIRRSSYSRSTQTTNARGPVPDWSGFVNSPRYRKDWSARQPDYSSSPLR
jgi:hypothetical protein